MENAKDDCKKEDLSAHSERDVMPAPKKKEKRRTFKLRREKPCLIQFTQKEGCL